MTLKAEPSVRQIELLALLDTFTLLTAQQLVRLGFDTNVQRVRYELERTARLDTARLIGRTDFRPVAYRTVLPRLHWLTPRGAAVLNAAIGADAVGSMRQFGEMNETMHRVSTVDFHIALRLWAGSIGASVPSFVSDFAAGSPGRHKATMLGGLGFDYRDYPADALALVGFPGGEELPVFFELERGGERGDLAAFRKKLPFLRSLMADTRLETALGVSTGVRIVVVFKDADMRQAALAQWPEPDAGVWGSFFIKALPELVPDFDDDWWHPNGSRRPMFGFQKPNGSTD